MDWLKVFSFAFDQYQWFRKLVGGRWYYITGKYEGHQVALWLHNQTPPFFVTILDSEVY